MNDVGSFFTRTVPRAAVLSSLQMMIAVFDFPEQSARGDDDAVLELIADYLRGYGR